MTKYNDLYIRDAYSDTGIIPSSGDAYMSPDIIPYQNKMLNWSTANSTYAGPDISKSIINNAVNNIYVRCKNLNNSAGSGTVSLYYANFSFILLPTTWTKVMSSGGIGSLSFVDESGNTSISSGSVALSNPSFYLAGLPGNFHYCFIAVIQTPTHPVTIPTDFSSNAEFVQWVQKNPSIGWRNISYSPNSVKQLSRYYRFGNINPYDTYFIFTITAVNHVPGTKVNCQCTDISCPINFDGSIPEPDKKGNQIVTFNVLIPPNFSGDLITTVTSPSGSFPIGADFHTEFLQVPDMSNELDLAVSKRFTVVSGTEENRIYQDAMLIKVGECTITITDNLEKVQG
ncbi:hypothetical protein ACSAZL_05005 [Methanosarcina sp. T3]|uniref:hypothetical protein n=1 Tax=Methanosarcina sp. T3 TaxID=3439062 RepID=UPI003F87AD4F